MKALIRSWQKLQARFDALSRRERAMVAAALVGGGAMIVFSLFIDPAAAKARQLRESIGRQRAEAQTLGIQVADLERQMKIDPDAGRKAERSALQKDLGEAEAGLSVFRKGLVPPREMRELLDSLLRRHPSVRLLSLKTLPPASLMELARGEAAASKEPGERKRPEGQAGSAPGFDLYRHGVEIRLEGSYPDLQAYLSTLERSPKRLLWGEARLTVADYPKAQLSVVVHTLSDDKTWLAL